MLGYFGEDRRVPRSLFLIGGPVGLAVTGAASIARNRAKNADAKRAAVPKWHRLGKADLVVTNQRLVVSGGGRTDSLWYAETVWGALTRFRSANSRICRRNRLCTPVGCRN